MNYFKLNISRAGGKTLLYGIPNSTRFYSRPNYNTPFLAGLVFLLLPCEVRQFGGIMTRSQALKDFRHELEKIDTFVNQTGQKATINLIDPDCNIFEKLIAEIELSIVWLGDELEKEDDVNCEIIDDDENLYRVGA